MKTLLTIGVLAITLNLVACRGLPAKPKGQLCVIHLEDEVLLCVDLKDSSVKDDIPLSEADGYLAVSPDTWANVVKYIKRLKIVARRRCR